MRTAAALTLAALWLAPAALAHPGGLNSSGCHTNRKTGDYHCHGGSSGSSSGGSSAPRPAPAPSSRPAAPQPQARPAVAGSAELVSVGDGDTIRVRDGSGQPVTIRLACIDAPETAQGQSGAMATGYLRQLVGNGPVEIRPQAVDRYGRTVAEVFVRGQNVNRQMVAAGAAFAYRDYLKGCDGPAYLRAEQQAETYRRGVWQAPGGGQRPWDFRRARRGG